MTDRQFRQLLETIKGLTADSDGAIISAKSRCNNTPISDDKLRKLEKFVFSRTRYGAKVRLRIEMYNMPATSAWTFNYSHRIEMFVPMGRDRHPNQYPKENQHRRRSGTVTWRSFEEEYLYVLAHEARHVDQNHAERIRWPELDAEAFAQQVLAEYRKEPFESVGELESETQKRVYPETLTWRRD